MTKTKQLEIWRTLTNGEKVIVGSLAQNSKGTFFQYSPDYLNNFPNGNLSPFKLHFNDEVQLAPRLFDGLHSVFADSLPDGWGRLLMDRVFAQHDISPYSITPMDRLAYVGNTAIGALSYQPISEIVAQVSELIQLAELGLQAQAIFDGQTEEILTALTQMGSSGGARPKAQVYFPQGREDICRTQYQQGDEAWLVKFTSNNLALCHEEGLCEAVYLQMAQQAGITVPQWKLVNAPSQSGARQWLALKRFDCIENGQAQQGRLHTLTACGLLEADFRQPSLDYIDLIKAANLLTQDLNAGKAIFRRALFNLFSCNQDDHSKNVSFVQNDQGKWSISPAYDMTFSPNPYGEHMTSFAGFGKNPPKKAIQMLAHQANLEWKDALDIIEQVRSAVGDFAVLAKDVGVKSGTVRDIAKVLRQVKIDLV
ncbi:type II toxin-antitoxin system HipA family toxin [Testudinibacter sp. TR-2022]|uniref:type II toxin-antitoxin system HipA family toxin n=1 Tax=Testudinibacter sp. TR-2022 TaxID=2585029 RepID=UPI001119D6EF|nr:type II toxin-antitoxin system HipA family toxin [Testudinibacter sp. TR-2022]TNG99969.1 type II toxin-antitoxin system HipA family toxin [Pasteurellaceae bacterium Phil31]TNH07235.1 type II toxin-antitoxin system HipA family toxin [Testudinibacter sp. TR-2022]TNH08780.1 type II toxin-antitoxin system HipA family toxin [Testudinibacter sp. TR-2022]TNH11436.1 type II toxin-antitoxin system HipA family toxin [Testudinibacter sp. TR-2022]TNH17439.1 type II toxin-antitoxin system HipA family to